MGNIANLHGQYLSNKEHRRIQLLVSSISQYIGLLTRPNVTNRDELLVNAVESIEGTIAYLIIDFKLSSIDQIIILLNPISTSIQNDTLDSRRNFNRMIIHNSLHVTLDSSN